MTVHRACAAAIAACIVAAPLTAAPVVPTDADTGAAVESALAEHDVYAAGVALNAVVQARLPKTAGRPDPIVDRLFVDYYAAEGASPLAAAILRRVVADPDGPDRGHYRLLLATYEEATGAFASAEARYRGLIADAAAHADDRLSATLGLARLQMAADPAAALATLAATEPHAVPAANAWEIDLLTARAASMIQPVDTAKVTAALDRAWREAPAAALTDSATSRVAGDRALLAGRSGDRRTLVTMLAVDRFNRAANSGQSEVAADLPLCGTAGIAPQDRVVIDVARLPAVGRPTVSLVWASRPGIAAPFLAAAEASGRLRTDDGRSAMFELACRTAPSTDYAVRNTIETATAEWMIDQGAYPLVRDEDDGPAAAASLLAQREARYGPTSVMLLPILFQILPADMTDLYGDETARKQAADSFARIGAILLANRAPSDLVLFWKMASLSIAVMAQTKTADEGQAEFETLLKQAAGDPNIPLDMLYMLALGTAQTPSMPSSLKATILSATLAVLERKAPAHDQRTAALGLALYSLRKSQGDDAGALATLTPLGLASDLCSLSDPPTHMISSNIKSTDYPGDLSFTGMRGLVRVEFDLDVTGNARDGRIILSDPPYAFDAITQSRIPTIHSEPARIGGHPAACRGVSQSVRWQLPY